MQILSNTEIILRGTVKRKKNIICRYIYIHRYMYNIYRFIFYRNVRHVNESQIAHRSCADTKRTQLKKILNIHISNSTKEVIRVKLIRHLWNKDCGTDEVHANPIIRLKFLSVTSTSRLEIHSTKLRAPRMSVSVSIHQLPRQSLSIMEFKGRAHSQ